MRNNQEPLYFAPQRKLDGGWLVFKSSPSPPPAPDYTGAATATAAGNLQAAQAAQQGNLINQNTPYGTLTYTQDPTSRFSTGNPSYTSDINLNQTGQQLLDYSNQSQLGLGALQTGATQNVADTMGKPFDLGSVQDTADASYKAQTARLDPQWSQNSEMNDAKLANQGIVPGTKAYDDQMRTFNQAKNDAYSQATQAAISTEPQTYQLAAAAYNQPLNELNAIRTGSQVTNPTFNNATPQQQTTAGPNYLGAATATGQYNQGLYNAQVGQQNATTSGLFSLGGAGMNAFMLGASDVRLKKDIHKVADDPRGFGHYTFRYKWDKSYESPRIGVMAQEVEKVMPDAVFSLGGEDGPKVVDYARI